MKRLFDCDDIGDTEEYLGCNIDRENMPFKFTQPFLVKSFKDEFDMPNCITINPGDPGTALAKAEEDDKVSQKRTTYFRRGAGKMLHMMHWSRSEIYNVVRDLSCGETKSTYSRLLHHATQVW